MSVEYALAQKKLRKELRRSSTPAEDILWREIRQRKVNGHRFRRQVTLGRYIVDFCSYKARLVIEVDGGYHSEEKQVFLDNERDNYLVHSNFRVLRFTNNQILEDLSSVLKKIRQTLDP